MARVRSWLGSIAPARSGIKSDALAALPGAIGSVPDGMAAGSARSTACMRVSPGRSLALLTLMAGVAMALAALARLERYTRSSHTR